MTPSYFFAHPLAENDLRSCCATDEGLYAACATFPYLPRSPCSTISRTSRLKVKEFHTHWTKTIKRLRKPTRYISHVCLCRKVRHIFSHFEKVTNLYTETRVCVVWAMSYLVVRKMP